MRGKKDLTLSKKGVPMSKKGLTLSLSKGEPNSNQL